MKLLWTPAANRDRKRIRSYIEVDNPAAALALDERLAQTAAHLEAYPFLGRPGRRDRTREFVAERNYILIYMVVADTVRILRVMHAARRRP
ncbi:type II toxin-antitoxin system RelE/ParE family toxin [Zavarzinia sp. CC-PAN008]|uniref:type II toxin-antitoxin system RelE/ParE family toxin n=1 Tax=Zavarzinia sp. CC-PAN008 TaxID=3243332 RepID=UPI003F744B84